MTIEHTRAHNTQIHYLLQITTKFSKLNFPMNVPAVEAKDSTSAGTFQLVKLLGLSLKNPNSKLQSFKQLDFPFGCVYLCFILQILVPGGIFFKE